MPAPGSTAEQYRHRLEDLTFMANTGESGVRAAERLGLNYDALQAWAHRHAPDVWRRLTARNPVSPNADHIGRNQYTAA